jgi:alkanesulfonate monooxygenase SsuD/methylene tetrahydromethanopterin reductase-like flavin-dependent oxidoreductase (luciferase family)
MTAVTCAIMRYHPAIIARAAATVGLLSNKSFTLGLGSGERLNAHVVGEGWPSILFKEGFAVRRIATAIGDLWGRGPCPGRE